MFFDMRGIVHSEFLPDYQIQRDPEVFASLSAWVEMRVVAGQLVADSPQNVPAHNVLSIQQFLAESNIIVLEQPSLYTWSCSMLLFTFSKLKRTHFEGMEAITRALTTELKSI